MWQVMFTKKASKQVQKLHQSIMSRVFLLVSELEESGPIRSNWKNFSKLGTKTYHCHIKKGNPTYVACWKLEDKKIKIIEVYYVGTHEKAPY